MAGAATVDADDAVAAVLVDAGGLLPAGAPVLAPLGDPAAAGGAVAAGAMVVLVAGFVVGVGAQAPSRVTAESSMPANRRRKAKTS